MSLKICVFNTRTTTEQKFLDGGIVRIRLHVRISIRLSGTRLAVAGVFLDGSLNAEQGTREKGQNAGFGSKTSPCDNINKSEFSVPGFSFLEIA